MNSPRPESARVRREIARQVRANPWQDYFADGARTAPALWIAGVLTLVCELAYNLGPPTMPRSGLEKWFDWLVSHIHLHQILVLPVLTFGILLVWHFHRGGGWRVTARTLLALAGESVALGVVLAVLIQAVRLVTFPGEIGNDPAAMSIANRLVGAIPSLAAVVSAGIHEEVLFRLALLGGGVAIARRLGVGNQPVRIGLVVAVSLLFAAIHYSLINPAGEAIDVAGFLCRFAVGLVFGAVYLTRGLALAIGIHCIYNIASLL